MTAPSDGQRKITWLSESKSTEQDGKPFPNNKVTTSKYTWYNFVPKNLFEQLHKFGNCYFLAISVLMYIGEKTPLFIGTIKAFSTLATLLTMMGVSALVAWLDDQRRAAADREINDAKARTVAAGGLLEEVKWQDVAVGDVVVVRQEEGLPADVVALYCCSEEGTCFVSTANLDGETNLKNKAALTETQKLLAGSTTLDSAETVVKRMISSKPDWRKAFIDAEGPNTSIYTFSGKISLTSGTKALGPDQLLLRGTVLKNTKFIIGVVVYTGKDTRMVMNSRPPAAKQANVEQIINRVMYVVLAAQAVLALISDALYLYFKHDYENLWYLYRPDLILPDPIGYFLTFFVLYSNLMPISLYPTLEVCNAAQTFFIKNDLRMYYKDPLVDDKEPSFPAGVRSSNLCQEIGQVRYIFSDKTGTLTQNVMELRRVSVKGRKYGSMDVQDTSQPSLDEVKTLNNDDMSSFLEVLSVCHTAVAAEGGGGTLRYEAESPDEVALVAGAQRLGWEFTSRFRSDVVVTRTLPSGAKKECKYVVHAVIEFNSTRKRMSSVVQDPDGSYFLFMKGADNVMIDRATQASYDYNSNLSEFSREGLRTLLFGRKKLSQSEFTNWLAKWEAAKQKVTGKEAELDKVAAEIENEVELVGVTAIEDKLQVGVPDTIELIRKAGVKLWVLTGDKLETARNIGFSAKVLTDSMNIQTIDPERTISVQEMARTLDGVVREFKAVGSGDGAPEKACLVTGAALEKITADEDNKKKLLEVADSCTIVIACRVSPLQKAEMVKLVRENVVEPSTGKAPITLAIGDGANDVPMIQEAQVGVGIAGKEGRQAVNNSDFAIGQFRFLGRLLLVHGRWNYRRVCKFTLFTFWRNAVQVLMTFVYTFFSGYSGTSLFEDWIRLSFNFLCSVPIMATGCIDQDLPDKVVLKHPELYEVGRDGLDLNPGLMGETFVSAIIHSVTLNLITLKVAPAMDLLGAGDYYTYGTAAYTLLLINTNVRVMALNYTHNFYTFGSFVISFLLYGFYLLAYPCFFPVANFLAPNMYMVPYHMVTALPFLICVIAVPMVAMTMDMVIQLLYVYGWGFRDRSTLMRTRVVYKLRKCFFECETKDANTVCDTSDETKSRVFPNKSCAWIMMPSTIFCPRKPERKVLNPPVDDSLFAQQRHRGWNLGNPAAFVLVFSIVSFLYLFGTGVLWELKSASVNQFRIHYAGETGTDGDDFARAGEVVNAKSCHDDKKCTVHVTVPEDMKPPILVYYQIYPFYQNHNFYLKSEVVKELEGMDVPEDTREKLCVRQTRIDADGNYIVPCGMKATSLFNDTFSIDGIDIHTEDTPWPEDAERYKNPDDYLHRDQTTWMYELNDLPELKEEGVESARFQVWMRPSAFPTVSNPYGYINRALHKDEELKVKIESHYPLPPGDAYKYLVVTEVTNIGGRSDFGKMLILAGVVSLIGGALAFTVAVMAKHQDEDPHCGMEDGYESEPDEFLRTDAGVRPSEQQPLLCCPP